MLGFSTAKLLSSPFVPYPPFWKWVTKHSAHLERQLVQFLRPRIYLGRYKWLNDGTTETIRKIVSHVFHCQRIFCDLIVTNILALEYSRE